MLSRPLQPLRDTETEAMDEAEKKLFEKAVRKRDVLVRSIQRVCTQIESMTREDEEIGNDVEAAKIDREDIERKMAEFYEVQSQIELDAEDDNLKYHEEERTRVETLARSARIVLADYLAANAQPVSAGNGLRRSLSGDQRAERKVKRPEIQIPKFEGDFRKWTDFKNVFESLVVQESAYTKVEKMVYLKQSVQGTAADVIKKFDISEKNFDKAWEKLSKRYENRRATINTHLKALTQLPQAKNESGLQKLLDAASDAIESLDSLGVKDGWPYMISYLVTEKLDTETRKAWEIETVKEPEYPKYQELESFLQQRVRIIESIGVAPVKQNVVSAPKKPETAKSFQMRKSSINSTAIEMKCFDCAENHSIVDCAKFAAKELSEKTELIKKKGLCFQCLLKGHMVLACKAPRCSKCAKRHHLLLHYEVEKADNSKSDAVEPAPEKKKTLCTRAAENCVAIPSALVFAEQTGGGQVVARAFLDSCSEVNLITENLVRKLKCSCSVARVVIETLAPGGVSSSKVCKVKLHSRSREFSVEVSCQIVPYISDNFVPYNVVKYSKFKIDPADDPKLVKNRVDILIGAEHFESIMLQGKLKVPGEPYLRETWLGWVAIGASVSDAVLGNSRCFFNLQDQLQMFFVLEEVGSAKLSWTSEEKRCDEHFEATHILDDLGFEVELPKELPVEYLGESRFIAFRQFCALERRLSEEEKVVYKSFMHEYEDLGHMTLVARPDPAEGRCYLPHHAVYKKSSTTSRMRSVFNASSPTSTGYSLNDVLMKGPVLQDDLMTIMLRFRCFLVAVTADIAKMYRQIRVKKEDRKLQCILWRDDPSEPVRTYELNTVTYGTKPASYIATKCLSKIAEKCEPEYPETATVLRRDFYMDDVLTSDRRKLSRGIEKKVA